MERGTMGAGEATVATSAARPNLWRRFAAWFRRYRFEIVLITPLLAYTLLFTFAPIVDTFRRSFSAPGKGFGTLQSYQAIFEGFSWTHPSEFERAIFNTIIVALFSLTLEMGIGLAIAMALDVAFFGRGFIRTVLLV